MTEASKLLRAHAKADAQSLTAWVDIEFSPAGASAEDESYIRVPQPIAMAVLAELKRLIADRLAVLGVTQEKTDAA